MSSHCDGNGDGTSYENSLLPDSVPVVYKPNYQAVSGQLANAINFETGINNYNSSTVKALTPLI